MQYWIKACIQLGKAKGFLTYSEVGNNLPEGDLETELLEELLMRLEEEKIELTSDPPVNNPEQIFHRFSPNMLEEWKTYPVRIRGPLPSECHAKPTLLVQSMQGGFATANCSECGNNQVLREAEFRSLSLWVSCSRCKNPMTAGLLSEDKGKVRLAANYGYCCSNCHIYILFADLLPRWKDLIVD